MKATKIISLFAVLILLGSCMTMKKDSNNALSSNTWELEYITGPRITFEGLYPDKKPMITFDPSTKNVNGNSGCNGYSAPYTVSGSMISFGEPGLSTMMYCGDGEQVFRNTMKKINKYSIGADGKLNLMMNDVVMMRFKKVLAK